MVEGARGASTGRSRHRLLSLLVVVEVALAMVVLIGAGLLARSFLVLRGIDSGYRSDGVLSGAVHLAPAQYAAPKDQSAFFQRVILRLEGVPGIQSVSAVSSLPLGSYGASISTTIEGRPESSVALALATVSPGYFRTLGIPLLRGRDVTDDDRDGSPGAIVVDQSFARRYCAGDDCLGTRIASWTHKGDWMSVVGVVGDVRKDPERDPSPTVYASYLQAGEPMMYLALRVAGDPATAASAVRRGIASVDHDQPPFDVMTLNDRLAEALAPQRANALLLGAFAVVALILGSIGIYGVVSYAVSQRTREIGVRIALGAGHGRVLSLVLRQCLVLVAIGEACGLAAAWALSRMMSSLVFQIATPDARTYAAATWSAVAVIACCIPARRAMSVNPVVALRAE